MVVNNNKEGHQPETVERRTRNEEQGERREKMKEKFKRKTESGRAAFHIELH